MAVVTAIIVTRGDVGLKAALSSLPEEWERLVWNNGSRLQWVDPENVVRRSHPAADLAVYGRYAAIEYASNDLIYVQDDDCVVSDPQAIVDAYLARCPEGNGPTLYWYEGVVCNMPPEFRHDFYTDHALVGFGACFHRKAPCRAFGRLFLNEDCINPSLGEGFIEATMTRDGRTWHVNGDHFHRTCDVAFTGLTPHVLVDVPKTNLWWAEDEARMYRQPQHVEERQRMLELVRRVQDV